MTASRFDGKVAVVTAGASGIGEAAVRGLAAQGARVVIGDVDVAHATALQEELGDGVFGAVVGAGVVARQNDTVALGQEQEAFLIARRRQARKGLIGQHPMQIGARLT